MSNETPIHWGYDFESLNAEPHPLPKYATVKFDVDGGRIAIRIVADTLYITEQVGHRLVIMPSAGNAIYLKLERKEQCD